MENEAMLGKIIRKIAGLSLGILRTLYDLSEKLTGKGCAAWHAELKKFLRKEPCWMVIADNLAEKSIAEWQAFYKKLFGIDYDFSNLTIPEKPGLGRWRLLIITDISLEIEIETLYAKCKELFPCWRWTDDNLDKIVTENERDAKNGAYAIWVKDEIEADEYLKNLSANDIKAKKITTETLAERLVHELKFFDETSKHLDIKNITLCTGSRYSHGFVPHVGWNDGEMSIDRCYPDYADGGLRSRQVVS